MGSGPQVPVPLRAYSGSEGVAAETVSGLVLPVLVTVTVVLVEVCPTAVLAKASDAVTDIEVVGVAVGVAVAVAVLVAVAVAVAVSVAVAVAVTVPVLVAVSVAVAVAVSVAVAVAVAVSVAVAVAAVVAVAVAVGVGGRYRKLGERFTRSLRGRGVAQGIGNSVEISLIEVGQRVVGCVQLHLGAVYDARQTIQAAGAVGIGICNQIQSGSKGVVQDPASTDQ